jgi:hypothetical protein
MGICIGINGNITGRLNIIGNLKGILDMEIIE